MTRAPHLLNLYSCIADRLKSFFRQRMPYVQQMEDVECGPACLTMVLRHHGYHASLAEVRERCGTSRDGVSALALKRAAETYGLNCVGLRIDASRLADVSHPTIIHWASHHFVVLEAMDHRGAWIVDPAEGRRHLPPEEFAKGFTGIALLCTPNENFELRPPQRGYWRFYLRLALSEPRLLIRVVAASLVIQLIGLALPLATQLIIDRIVLANQVDLLSAIAVGIAGFVLFEGLMLFIRGVLLIHLQIALDSRLMLEFFSHLLRLPYSFFLHRSSGDLVSRLNSITMFREMLSGRGASLLLDVLFVATYFVLMYFYSPVLAGVTTVVGLAQVAVLLLLAPATRTAVRQDLISQARTQSFAIESLRGIALIKASGLEEKVLNHWAGLLREQMDSTQKRSRLAVYGDSLLGGIRVLSPLILLWLGSRLVIAGQLTLGEMLGFNALAAAFLAPIASMVAAGQQMQILSGIMERFQDVMQAEPESKPAEGTKGKSRLRGNIRIEHLHFSYSPQSGPVLHDISLSISAGQKVALVGATGSGKSTLLKLLLHLFDPDRGRILFDGHDLKHLSRQELRRQIGVVPQETFVFHETIRHNISIFQPGMSQDQVEWAAKVAELHDEIMSMPMGYDTVVSEGSTNFSGGQMQRLAIARAVACRPSILLFDEATSELDNITEQAIERNLKTLGCTRIIVAHRLSTLEDSDLIVVLHKGRVIELGTHQALLAREGLYSRLVLNGSLADSQGQPLQVPNRDKRIPYRGSMI